MIRFKCVYCGQKVTAKDEQKGKKGKCPKCSHTILIPFSTKGKPALDPDISESSQKMMEAYAMFQIATQKDEADEDVPIGFETPAWFVPTYDKLSLFLIAILLIILGAINPMVLQDILKLIKLGLKSGDTAGVIIALLVLSLGGMVFSIYYMFTSKEADDSQKKYMVSFAAVSNALISGFAAHHLLKHGNDSGLLLIFPTWNLISAGLIILMLLLKIINRNCIIDRDISFCRVVISLILSIIILLVCECIFKIYWAITLSICMFYTTSFDRAIQNTILDKLGSKEQLAK